MSYTRNPALPPVQFSRGAKRVLRALLDTVVAKEPVVANMPERLLAAISLFVPYMPPLTRYLLPLGLWLFEWGTVVFFFAPLPFSKLSYAARLRYIHGWQKSRFSLRRQLVKGLRALAMMGYFGLPEVHAHIGYVPEPFVTRLMRERAARLGKRGLPVVVEPHSAAALAEPVPLRRAGEAS